jgi:hypothetical protein
VGEGWPLSARRAWFEWEGLSEQHRHAAGRVPTPIHYDPALFAFAMSYLSPHIILRRGTPSAARLAPLDPLLIAGVACVRSCVCGACVSCALRGGARRCGGG